MTFIKQSAETQGQGHTRILEGVSSTRSTDWRCCDSLQGSVLQQENALPSVGRLEFGIRVIPSASQEAGNASDVHAGEVAEIELGEVCICVGLQHLNCLRPLQCQKGAVIMDCHIHLSAFTLQSA